MITGIVILIVLGFLYFIYRIGENEETKRKMEIIEIRKKEIKEYYENKLEEIERDIFYKTATEDEIYERERIETKIEMIYPKRFNYGWY